MTARFGTDPYGGQNFPFGHRLASSQFNNLVNWVRNLDSAAEIETVCSWVASSSQAGNDTVNCACYDETLGFWLFGGQNDFGGAGDNSAVYVATDAGYLQQDATVTDVETLVGIAANGSGTVVACGVTPANTATKLLSTPDGFTWTARNLSGATVDVCAGAFWEPINSKFVVGLSADHIEFSANGTAWTAAASVGSGAGETWKYFASNGTSVAVSVASTASAEVLSTTDCDTWTDRAVAAGTYKGLCYCSAQGKFFTHTNSTILGSADGVTWAAGTATLPADLTTAYYSTATTNLVLLSYHDGTTYWIAASDDGCATWRKVCAISAAPTFITYADGQLMAGASALNTTVMSTVKIIASL